MAYQALDVLKAMEADLGRPLRALIIDRGAASNNFIAQFQVDLLGVDVVRAPMPEATALGVAFLAGVATGFWAARTEVASLLDNGDHFALQMGEAACNQLLAGWRDTVARTLLQA